MNICLVTMEWPPFGCGIGTYMFNLARGLNSFGHNVTVITNDKEPLACDGVDIISVQVPQVNGTLWRRIQKWRMEPYHTWSVRAYKRFTELCSDKEFDIIETAEFGAWGRYFVGHLDIPVVVRCHNPTHIVWSINHTPGDSYKMPLWLRLQDRYERQQTFHSDAIVSPSQSLANHLSLSWVIPRNRFTVLPNPIDTELFNVNGDTMDKQKEILYVGRLQFNKGSFDLAESVRPLLKKYPDLTVRFIGMDAEPPEQFRQYGRMASEVICSMIPSEFLGRVIFVNHQPVSEIIPFLQKAICTVMPTRGFESFSYTVLEAMSCGCPVIATQCGGPTEIITDGMDGLLVRPGDTAALTTAMEKLIESPWLCENLSIRARQTVQRHFATSVIIPRIIRFYEQAISRFRGKTANGTQSEKSYYQPCRLEAV